MESHTWDGQIVSPRPRFGAAIVVYRRSRGGALEFLVLHRRAVPPDDADWSWGPPSGARWPGEDIVDTAQRELFDETDLDITPVQAGATDSDWVTFQAEIDPAAAVSLSIGHDRFAWLPLEAAIARVSPEEVRAPLRTVGASFGSIGAIAEPSGAGTVRAQSDHDAPQYDEGLED